MSVLDRAEVTGGHAVIEPGSLVAMGRGSRRTEASGHTQPSEGRWGNHLNWQAVWNCCQEALNHRDLPIWLREHGVIKGKRDGQAANKK